MSLKTIESNEIYKIKTYRLLEEKIELPSGKVSTHVTLDHPGAVVILPEISTGVFLVLSQYRHSIKREIVELPAGTLGVGEDPLFCAKRELMEEAGYEPQELIPLGTLYPAPGFCNEVQYLYFARNLTPNKLPQDEDEIITVKRVSIDEIFTMVDSGELMDAKSLVCLLRAQRAGLL